MDQPPGKPRQAAPSQLIGTTATAGTPSASIADLGAPPRLLIPANDIEPCGRNLPLWKGLPPISPIGCANLPKWQLTGGDGGEERGLMLMFFAVVAAANLCIGYILGAYIGILPGFARRLPEDMAEAGGNFSEPMTPSISDPSSLLEREMEIPGIPSSNATDEILAGLADFRSKLKKLNDRLHESAGNRPALDHCANQLRQANHEYLEDANQAITRLEDETEGTSQHDQFKTSVLQQAEAVGQANAAIDSLLTSSNLEEVHQGLVATTDQLDKQASEVERHASDTHGSPDEERWAADRIVSLSKLIEQASQQLESSNEVQQMPMAGIMLDTQLADGTVVDVTPRLVDGLLKVVAPLLEDGQLVASDQGKLLMLLVGDDEASAIQRCERLRQQVATTTFVCDGERRRLTASCSVVDNATGLPVDQILTNVEETLVEARRYGPNRCFHHDGKFPAPVVPHTMGVEELTVEI